MVDFESRANRPILAYLGDPSRLRRSVSAVKAPPSCAPSEVEDPYYRLGAHPDLLQRLWDELGGALPVDCRWVVFGTPVLAHPCSGVVFAFGGGTHTYALRLPPADRADALAAGAERVHEYRAYPELAVQASVLDLRDIGEEWVFGGWREGEGRWCLAAYNYAGERAG